MTSRLLVKVSPGVIFLAVGGDERPVFVVGELFVWLEKGDVALCPSMAGVVEATRRGLTVS